MPRLTTLLAACLPLALLAACGPSSHSLDVALDIKPAGETQPGLKWRDFKPVPIKGRQPDSFPIHGLDISRYNKLIDWRTAKKAGVEFVFIKATEGMDDRDPEFRRWWREVGSAGIPRSAYHFYYFCATPEAQAANYIDAVPKRDKSLPPVLDVEWNPKSPTCKRRPPPSEVRNVLKRWLTRIERHYGQKPIIYTTVDFYADNLSDGSLPGYQYWLRSVRTEPKYKYPGRPWVFWQHTGTGSVPGVTGEVDINAFNGSRAAWNRWLARNMR
ncbi:MAG: GH25 family lysozyme [Ahrensia sp.]|nr:GH25 family lysozyme [Ahrensia sp.]